MTRFDEIVEIRFYPTFLTRTIRLSYLVTFACYTYFPAI